MLHKIKDKNMRFFLCTVYVPKEIENKRKGRRNFKKVRSKIR